MGQWARPALGGYAVFSGQLVSAFRAGGRRPGSAASVAQAQAAAGTVQHPPLPAGCHLQDASFAAPDELPDAADAGVADVAAGGGVCAAAGALCVLHSRGSAHGRDRARRLGEHAFPGWRGDLFRAGQGLDREADRLAERGGPGGVAGARRNGAAGGLPAGVGPQERAAGAARVGPRLREGQSGGDAVGPGWAARRERQEVDGYRGPHLQRLPGLGLAGEGGRRGVGTDGPAAAGAVSQPR